MIRYGTARKINRAQTELDILTSKKIFVRSKYCIQCGKIFQKPPELDQRRWYKRLRCDECLSHPEKLNHQKYCSKCGTIFVRKEEHYARWNPRSNCDDCKIPTRTTTTSKK